jgi:hypothetical protein
MTLEAWRSFQSSYTVEQNPVLLPKLKTLFLNHEHQELQEQPDAVREILESWDALNSDGERAMIPAKQLITQLQTRQKEIKNQRDAILIASAVVAVLVAATVTLVLVWRRGLLRKSSANDGISSPVTEEGDHDTPDNETPTTQRPDSRYVSRRLTTPSV